MSVYTSACILENTIVKVNYKLYFLERNEILVSFFLESANMNSSTSPFPGKYFENVFENQSPFIPQTHRIRAT